MERLNGHNLCLELKFTDSTSNDWIFFEQSQISAKNRKCNTSFLDPPRQIGSNKYIAANPWTQESDPIAVIVGCAVYSAR